MQKDYYKILGVSVSATQPEIKKAYHELAKKYHPDRNTGESSSEDIFKEINEAYHILSDKVKKHSYDLHFRTGIHFVKTEYEPYLAAKIHSTTARVNEEFEITYSYPGEGRIFKRPESAAL